MKLQRICTVEKEMVRKLGASTARVLKRRLAEFAAAAALEHLRTLPGPRCHELAADRTGSLAVDLDHPRRLIFRPQHDPVPLKADGGLDWSRVTEVLVEEIADYH